MVKTVSSVSWIPLPEDTLRPVPCERHVVAALPVVQFRRTGILEISRLQGTSEPEGQSHSPCEELSLTELRILAYAVLRLGLRTIGRRSGFLLRGLWHRSRRNGCRP